MSVNDKRQPEILIKLSESNIAVAAKVEPLNTKMLTFLQFAVVVAETDTLQVS